MQTFITKPVDDMRFKYLVKSLNLALDFDDGPWIAGGSVRKLWFNQPWDKTDIDIFYTGYHQFDRISNLLKPMHASLYNSLVEESNKQFDDIDFFSTELRLKPAQKQTTTLDNMHMVPYETNNAVSYKIKIDDNIYKIQSIKRAWHSSARDMIDQFDFTVCNFFTDGNTLFTTQDVLDDCSNNRLRFNDRATQTRKLHVGRVIKYSLYGFNPSVEIMEELFRQKNANELAIGDVYD